MNHYVTSTGERVSQSQVDKRIRKAKAKLLQYFLDDNGYIYCEKCQRSDIKPIDCSHIISVDKCKKEGRIELSWDVGNMRLLCRNCHKKFDKLNIHQKKIV